MSLEIVQKELSEIKTGLASQIKIATNEVVKEALPYFHGRKHELNRMRGIHIPARINFD